VRRPALFVALTIACFVWTFPHTLVVERLVRTALARVGVATSIESVEARWPKIVRMSVSPPGYIDRQGTATDVQASIVPASRGWQRVGTVQLGLVVSSPSLLGVCFFGTPVANP